MVQHGCNGGRSEQSARSAGERGPLTVMVWPLAAASSSPTQPGHAQRVVAQAPPLLWLTLDPRGLHDAMKEPPPPQRVTRASGGRVVVVDQNRRARPYPLLFAFLMCFAVAWDLSATLATIWRGVGAGRLVLGLLGRMCFALLLFLMASASAAGAELKDFTDQLYVDGLGVLAALGLSDQSLADPLRRGGGQREGLDQLPGEPGRHHE